ncbi:MAG: type I 3-dehydroquinate dehydratase [Dehalococcoidales bacterium]|nr:type I 3-dehydroquinate dehydratase [Dehalococcoidales bacterium]
MQRPRICAAIVENDPGIIEKIESLVDLFEVRIDLIGPEWPELVKRIRIPWIACNRRPEEGGKGQQDEGQRVEELLRAVEAGAAIADIELKSKGLAEYVPLIKARARCLVSFHDYSGTPPFEFLVEVVRDEKRSGADICKVVTSAREFADNLTLLKLIGYFPGTDIVAFAMNEAGKTSRILTPLAGGYFTYASLAEGKESAAGQIPVKDLVEIYGCMKG